MHSAFLGLFILIEKILNSSDVFWRTAFYFSESHPQPSLNEQRKGSVRTKGLNSLDHTTSFNFLFSSPGCLSWCNNIPLMSFTVRVTVEKHVTLQTQPLDTCGALSVNRRNPTDAAGLYRHKQTVKNQQKQTPSFRSCSRMTSCFKSLL